jgi:succinyl-CoA synthetase beta subunit
LLSVIINRGKNMKLHEFQAKEILRKFGIPVPEGQVASSAEEAARIAEGLKGPPWVVKAQVHAGGRGKGGGVRVVSTPDQVEAAARSILENPLITKQTGPEGKKVHQVLIEEGVEIGHEFYLAMTVDRSRARPLMIFSQAGGMDIEEVAAKSPDMVLRQFVDPLTGWMPFQGRSLVYSLNPLPGPEVLKELMALMGRIHRIFPRQKEMQALDDPREKDPLDAKAHKYNLNYIRLSGNIGAMVNGAGLAMATMDLIKMAGAEPANFLDVGGGASEEMVTRGFEIILEDEKVRAILINIFGGILRCDVLARGVLAAASKTAIRVPLIVRLEGTNVEEGRRILRDSGLKFLVAKDMGEAAAMVTQQVS